MKLWTQTVDSKGSTVSQFHSFTKRHGGWVPRKGRGVGLFGMGGWGSSRGQGSGFGDQKDREQGSKETEKQGLGSKGARERVKK